MKIDTLPRPDHFYMLDENGEPFAVDDIRTWAKWFETAERHVDRTEIGEHVVSTVFLGIDHSLGRTYAPLLYESLVFVSTALNTSVRQPPGAEFEYVSDEQYDMRRYATRAQAQAGHDEIVAEVRKRLEALA